MVFRLNYPQNKEPDVNNVVLQLVTLTNPTTSSTDSALIQFSQIACEDETEFMCQVAYAGSVGSTSTDSDVANISVKGNPEQPDREPVYVPSAGIEEGNDVVFTCTGNLGKPQGKFRWFQNVFLNDSRAYNHDSEDRVRNVQVTKSPIIPTFAEGAGPITLTCSSDGNPVRTNIGYTWYKEFNTSVPLGTGPTYVINNVVVNKTDNYICVAQNSFNGQTFNMNNTIHIQIGIVKFKTGKDIKIYEDVNSRNTETHVYSSMNRAAESENSEYNEIH
ncbi:unnamed protein product [Mytilus coruscus]|uniref:Ig-like domain-containing protein n=1 Tax=Mytilus coruscus TaxID=42192 RepID=A0A6J8B3F0_MYTCO|nr:unnamed protein product [Mytilus coruscus]